MEVTFELDELGRTERIMKFSKRGKQHKETHCGDSSKGIFE